MEKANYPIRVLCRVMEVSRSGFYDYLRRQNRKEEMNREKLELLLKVKEIFEESQGSYGRRRMSKQLRLEGYEVGPHQAKSLMRDLGLEVKSKRRYRVTTQSRHDYPVAPNLLNRDFNPSRANQAWVGDITYLWTAEGWLYLAVLLDLYSRRVIGRCVDDHMRVDLVKEALLQAIWSRKPKPGLIHHSDRGSQYACKDYQALLNTHQITPSMSRKGNCWDNAVAESFFKSLKSDRTNLKLYKTKQEAKDDVIDYIEMFYNPKRLHSTLGYLSPNDFELKNLKSVA